MVSLSGPEQRTTAMPQRGVPVAELENRHSEETRAPGASTAETGRSGGVGVKGGLREVLCKVYAAPNLLLG